MKLVLALLPTVAAASGSGASASGGHPYAAFDSTAGTVQDGFLSIEGDGGCKFAGKSGGIFRANLVICSGRHKTLFDASLEDSDFCAHNTNGIFLGLTPSQAADKCKRHHHCRGFQHGTITSSGVTETQFLAYPPTGRDGVDLSSTFNDDLKCYQQVEGYIPASDEGMWMTVAIVAIVSIPVSMLGAMAYTGYLTTVLMKKP